MNNKNISYKKIALALSIVLLIAWGMMGAGTSLAWFTDTTPEIRNIFHVAEFELAVSVRQKDGSYKKIDSETKIFDDQALYEPGYVQVVYLKVENKGTIPVDYKTAVSVTDFTPAKNVFGQTFHLQDYLKFAVLTADTEEVLMEKLRKREQAVCLAGQELNTIVTVPDMPLNMYETESHSLEAKGEDYVALIVHMPSYVGNVANYRGNVVPKVELGVIVNASQQRN